MVQSEKKEKKIIAEVSTIRLIHENIFITTRILSSKHLNEFNFQLIQP